MAWILRRLPGAGLLREAWHATQLQGAIHEKKRAERALVLAEQNAQIGESGLELLSKLGLRMKVAESNSQIFKAMNCKIKTPRGMGKYLRH